MYGPGMDYPDPWLIVMCGYPASGKSTLAEELAKQWKAEVYSADAIRKEGADPREVMRSMYRNALDRLSVGGNAIVDACNLRPGDLDRWHKMPVECSKRLVVIQGSYDYCCQRNAARKPSQRARMHGPVDLAGLAAYGAELGFLVEWMKMVRGDF